MGFDPSVAQGQPCIPREIPGAGKGNLAREAPLPNPKVMSAL